MSEIYIERRRILTFGAVTALSAWSALDGSPIPALKAQEPGALNGEGLVSFVVTIPGLPEASKNIREIAIDELNIDAREMKGDRDVGVRTISPRRMHFGSARITSACTLGGSKELQAWWQEAAKGKNIRKSVTVTLFKSDKSPGRSYNLLDCFPTQWSSVNFDTSSTVQTETITVKMGRVELA